MDDVTGADGELIDLLIDLIRRSPEGDRHRWRNAGIYAVAWVGGHELARVEPVSGDEDDKPDSVAAEMRRTRTNVTVDEWFSLMRDRLRELVSWGVAEDFLVQAIRDQLERNYERLASVGGASEIRAERRRELLAMADDPKAVERFRDILAEKNPSIAGLHLDQVADKLRDMAESSMLDPVDADEAGQRWAELEAWRAGVAAILSDDVIDRWGFRSLR